MNERTLPDFELTATGGAPFRFSELRGKKLVLYFYPKDGTPGCTTEAQEFRDLHDRFVKAGAVVFGVSRDSLKSHENFKAKQALPFELISDATEALSHHFSVIKDKKLYGKPVRGIERSTFLFDGKGILRHEWRGVKAPGHAEVVLETIEAL